MLYDTSPSNAQTPTVLIRAAGLRRGEADAPLPASASRSLIDQRQLEPGPSGTSSQCQLFVTSSTSKSSTLHQRGLTDRKSSSRPPDTSSQPRDHPVELAPVKQVISEARMDSVGRVAWPPIDKQQRKMGSKKAVSPAKYHRATKSSRNPRKRVLDDEDHSEDGDDGFVRFRVGGKTAQGPSGSTGQAEAVGMADSRVWTCVASLDDVCSCLPLCAMARDADSVLHPEHSSSSSKSTSVASELLLILCTPQCAEISAFPYAHISPALSDMRGVFAAVGENRVCGCVHASLP